MSKNQKALQLLHYSIIASKNNHIGSILVATTLAKKGVCSVLFGNNDADLIKALQERYPRCDMLRVEAQGDGVNNNKTSSSSLSTTTTPAPLSWANTIDDLISDPTLQHDIPIDIISCTDFQSQVWKALTMIPVGETKTYAEVAEMINSPQSVRAVANACGANPVALLIPCHRVVRTDGGLGGYRWGVERKEQILALEKKKKQLD